MVEKLPPHLSILSHKQVAFVRAFAETCDQAAAARAAGYDGRWAAQRGYEWMRNPKIREAINQEQLQTGHRLRGLAIRVWEKALESGDRKAALAAAKEVADRFGLAKVTKTESTVTHQFENMTEDEIREFIKVRAKASKIIDVTPVEEVEDAVEAMTLPLPALLPPLPPPLVGKGVVVGNADAELAKMIGEAPLGE